MNQKRRHQLLGIDHCSVDDKITSEACASVAKHLVNDTPVGWRNLNLKFEFKLESVQNSSLFSDKAAKTQKGYHASQPGGKFKVELKSKSGIENERFLVRIW